MQFQDFPLGKAWHDNFYPLATEYLGYSESEDRKSRDLLSNLLEKKGVTSFDEIFREKRDRFKNKNRAIIFGAGPSLGEDILALYPLARKSNYLVIAADGAADALGDAMIFPDIIVSDLDSCSENTLTVQSEKRLVFAHAHGDNKKTIANLIPKMGRQILGTTQVESLANVRNLGGLTDGDRACYITSSLEPSLIVIAGMDFGLYEGEYSKNKQMDGAVGTEGTPSETRLRGAKMTLGRQSLEFLIRAKKEKIRFANLTSRGENIEGAERFSVEELMKDIS